MERGLNRAFIVCVFFNFKIILNKVLLRLTTVIACCVYSTDEASSWRTF